MREHKNNANPVFSCRIRRWFRLCPEAVLRGVRVKYPKVALVWINICRRRSADGLRRYYDSKRPENQLSASVIRTNHYLGSERLCKDCVDIRQVNETCGELWCLSFLAGLQCRRLGENKTKAGFTLVLVFTFSTLRLALS